MPWWLLFNKLKNKACQCFLIVAQFCDGHYRKKTVKLWIQVVYMVTTSVVNYTGDCYMQVNLTVNIRGDFW